MCVWSTSGCTCGVCRDVKRIPDYSWRSAFKKFEFAPYRSTSILLFTNVYQALLTNCTAVLDWFLVVGWFAALNWLSCSGILSFLIQLVVLFSFCICAGIQTFFCINVEGEYVLFLSLSCYRAAMFLYFGCISIYLHIYISIYLYIYISIYLYILHYVYVS